MDSPQISATAVLLDTERLQFQKKKPFGMELLHFYPLRGSLGRKPGRATQAKVRAREKIQKKKKQKMQKDKKRTKKKDAKKRTKKSKKEKELKRKAKLARSKTCNRRLGKS